VLAACGGNRYAPPPPAQVTVAHPVEREVTLYSEFSGHTVAVSAVDVRARVQGYLQSIHFTPGGDVKEGDLLFVIEPDLYQARVEQFEADLARAEAQAQAANQQLEIAEAIFQRNAGSKTDLVQKTQQRDQARAAVAQAKATLEAAQLDLSYTHVVAPIGGRIDPSPYRTEIEATEALLYTQAPLTDDGWKDLSRNLLELHNAIVFRDNSELARETSRRLFFLSAQVDAEPLARHSAEELVVMRGAWEKIRTEQFASADWFHAGSP